MKVDIFLSTYDGIVLAHHRPEHIGRNLCDMTDPNGVKVHQTILKAGTEPGGGYMEYIGTKNPVTGKPGKKITFSKSIDDWKWLTSSGFYIDNIEPVIAEKRKQLAERIKSQIIHVVLIFLVVGALATLIMNIFSRRIRKQFDLLNEYFKRSVTTYEKVDKNELVYEEFRTLSDFINKMVDEHKQAEEVLRRSEEKYRTLYESSRDAIMLLTPEEGFVSGNPAALKIFGCKDEKEFTSRTPQNLSPQYQPDGTLSSEKDKQMIAIAMEKGSHFFEWTHKRVDGQEFPATVLLTRMELQGRRMLQATVRDITKRKQAQEERKKLEAQLSQAQKMEAIGVLAGGVAHDFNNLLTVIIGNAQLALMDVIKDESLRKEIGEIKKAGDRAASLTRQLLAFSRKQIITPRVLDLNELLTDIEKMLARLIAEDVELLTIIEPALWQVEVDPGQMEQVIMNLAVNARDAMSTCADSAAGRPRGGKLTIEMANIDLAENYFHEHGIKNEPGSYVMLAVSDTGIGMDKETREHIFEPFFTTKEVGKGTGLGLSTVYGIVKQNNGFIWVCSEPGQGTTFKVYLPKVKGDAEPEEKEQTPVIELGGSETVLIVEDDEGLRRFAQEVLQQHGYKVLDAENGEDALRVCKEHDGQIDLMITDVVMPKMGGREAAKRMQPLYPQMKVIYMSGYTDNAIVHHGVLSPGLNFLQKPFTPEGLARKVRETLNAEN